MTMSLNQRSSRTFKLTDFLNQIANLTNYPVLRHFRQSFAKANDFSELQDYVLKVKGLNIGAPYYIIMNNEVAGLVA